ncbi:uncharacterized protein LOC130813663 [Amaranthus tricolor]|uniref:uncharacterized protein LOC130813663 n=1 Tax=Amaranthus tricolor TaxID=29722 RepID=UPI00258BD917|nr:uncharacterized protein LOC130813663 [Amaranthus tricolor]
MELEGIIKEDLGVKYEFCLWYHLPNALSFLEGLKRVTDDICVGNMSKIAVENRALSVYVVSDKDDEIYEPDFGNSAKVSDEDASEEDDSQDLDYELSHEKFKWIVGQVFSTPIELKEAIRKYAIHQGRNVKFCLSDKSKLNKLGVRCIDGCPFKLYASWDKTRASFIVKKVNGDHTCQRNIAFNCQFKASWCADQLLNLFKSKPHIPSTELVDIVRKEFRIIISKGFAYKIKYAAHRRLHGSMKQHYLKFMSYVGVLEQSKPNSHFIVVTDPCTNPPTFQKIFVCFEGVKDGWVGGCKKIFCIDGCFLKTFLGGMLLSAVGRDPNEKMYLLAWAVVEDENNESWQWFIYELKKCVPHDNGKELIVISDEHQSILRAVQLELPKAEHRHCARHIYANWNKSFKGEEMKLLFLEMCQSI